MNTVSRFLIAACAVVTASIPAFAGVTINEPTNNSDISSPFKLSASASSCSSQSVSSMGYSFDSSSDTTVIKGQTIDQDIDSSTGSHTLHIKAWGDNGASCVEDVVIDVKSSSSSSSSGNSSEIPSDAKTVSSIQALSGWNAQHDTGGSGSSSGSTTTVSSPSLYGSTRRFETSFKSGGDERFSKTFSDDTSAENFFYDAWIYLTSDSNNIGNIELDLNQVMSDGKTVLAGVQCDGYTGKWDYTVNTGSASNVKPKWYGKSGSSCNPRSWSQNKWHHVQYNFSRDGSGNITYKSIWLDGKETVLNAKAFGAADLGWGPIINTQFQVDGHGSSGSTKVYVDSLTISRW